MKSISKADLALLSDSFQIHELIGQSHHSLIYRATSSRGFLRGRQVALKVTPKRHLTNETRESCELLRGLHHPCIVSRLTTMVTPNAFVRVLELCDSTLERLCQFGPPGFLSETTLRQLLLNTLSAACYLEAQGVCMERLDSSQVLLTRDGRLKLNGTYSKAHYSGDFRRRALQTYTLFALEIITFYNARIHHGSTYDVKRPCSPVLADFLRLLRSISRSPDRPGKGIASRITLKQLNLHPFLAVSRKAT